MKGNRKLLLWGGLGFVCALGLIPRQGKANVIADPTVREFGIYKDTDGDGELSHGDTKLACVTNMLQYVSAATSYGYKQYDNPKGADLSAWPNSGEGMLTGTTHKTWLTPEPNSLQFWMGWSRMDHDPGTGGNVNPDFETTGRGFNMGIIMNRENKHWDQSLNGGQGGVVHDLGGSAARNTVNLDISVKGSSTTAMPGEPNDLYNIQPRVLLSDDFSENPADFPVDPPNSKELPRPPAPTAGDPFPVLVPSQELIPDATVDAGWDYHFLGDWTYHEDAADSSKANTTDGGVLGNLRPEGLPGEFMVRITLDQLFDGEAGHTGIDKIYFYSFKDPGTYDPLDPASYDASASMTRIELSLSEGDTFFITDCCNSVPEPITVALLTVGGLGVAGIGWWQRRRRAAV